MITFIYQAIMAVQRSRSVIADLVQSDPNGWNWGVDQYRLNHAATNVRIWIANEAYGLHYDIKTEAGWEEVRPGFAERLIIWAAVSAQLDAAKVRREKHVRRRIQKAIDAIGDRA